jgi:hypothetical protein
METNGTQFVYRRFGSPTGKPRVHPDAMYAGRKAGFSSDIGPLELAREEFSGQVLHGTVDPPVDAEVVARSRGTFATSVTMTIELWQLAAPKVIRHRRRRTGAVHRLHSKSGSNQCGFRL